MAFALPMIHLVLAFPMHAWNSETMIYGCSGWRTLAPHPIPTCLGQASTRLLTPCPSHLILAVLEDRKDRPIN